jgi:hypothetical protein
MSRPVRSFLSLLLVLQLIIPFSASAAAIGEFSKVVGGVTQTRAQQIIKPVAKAPIELKDIIMTDQASAAIMVFSDDSTIKLEQNSKLEVKEFLFKDKARTGIFSLATGKLTATVRKFIGDDNLFEVHSPTSVAGVRGTGFEFTESMVGGTPTATITCTEGSLTISALSPTGVIVATSVITAGMTAVVSGGVITAATTMAGIMGTAATAFSGMSTAQAVGVVALGLAGGGAAVAVGQAASGGGGGKSTVSYSDLQLPGPAGVINTINVSSVNVTTISIYDMNGVQDDFYDLYVNGANLGPVNNVPGGTTNIGPVVLLNGNNTIKLKLTSVQGSGTGARLTVTTPDFVSSSANFWGTADHTWTIIAP